MSEMAVHIHDDLPSSKERISSILLETDYRPIFHTKSSAINCYDDSRIITCCMVNVENNFKFIDEVMMHQSEKRLNPVIMYSERPPLSVVVHAIKNGVFDFLEFPLKEDEVRKSIESAEKIYKKTLIELLELSDISSKLTRLTLRENVILEQIMLGYRNKIIAYNLNISQRTVENHRSNIMHKLGATSIGHLMNMVNRILR